MKKVVVLGAGVAGSMAAFFLRESGVEVLLVDRSSLAASGGSGAAGAFVSPKIGKGGLLQQLTNEAFSFAQRFYREHFPDAFHGGGVLRIPKNEADAEKFHAYEVHNLHPYERWSAEDAARVGIRNVSGGFYFPEAGDVDAQRLCQTIATEVGLHSMEVERLRFDGKRWLLEGSKELILADAVILATGYESDLLDLRYMGIKGLWGSRGDYATDGDFPVSFHKDFSLSSQREGRVKLGATHVKDPSPYLSCAGRPLAELEAKAAELVDSSDFHLVETFCGMRSGSRDFFPLVGPVLDVPRMLAESPAVCRGAKVPLLHYENLYILNGLGGRGFVFAPLMARWLAQCVIHDKQIDSRVNPDRLFWKWVRKEGARHAEKQKR